MLLAELGKMPKKRSTKQVNWMFIILLNKMFCKHPKKKSLSIYKISKLSYLIDNYVFI